ncbi:hypothetical protein B0H14DRAFT_3497387 [Mycena olivaceomarginata]|nr:hypothetical protein B0H14DRAFT_3497387 [Mycena olivaceomarginata]
MSQTRDNPDPTLGSNSAHRYAGITISKRHNRLNPDIVEALQVLKCMIKRDLIFRESALVDDDGTDDLQAKESSNEEQSESGLAQDEGGWDGILADEPDNYDPDYQMDC